MGGAVVLLLVLTLGAWLLFAPTAALHQGPVRGRARTVRTKSKGRVETESESLPRLVRQMSSLLAAGRTGPELWGILAHVLASESRTASGRLRARVGATGAAEEIGQSSTVALLLAVQRASVLGLSSAQAIRTACSSDTPSSQGRRRVPILSAGQQDMWLEIAACLEVCESSGAPVAAVLNRLALTIESDFDAAALRETALAGPRATVRLLGWLPFIGLGLGIAMGVDPLSVLFGSPVGWAVLCAGLLFTVTGRMWSAALISHAAHPSGSRASRSPEAHRRRTLTTAKRRR